MHEGFHAPEDARAVRKTKREYASLLERMFDAGDMFFRYPAVQKQQQGVCENRVLPEIHGSKFWKEPR